MSVRLRTVAALVGQTDGIGRTISRSACMDMLTRDKNGSNLVSLYTVSRS